MGLSTTSFYLRIDIAQMSNKKNFTITIRSSSGEINITKDIPNTTLPMAVQHAHSLVVVHWNEFDCLEKGTLEIYSNTSHEPCWVETISPEL